MIKTYTKALNNSVFIDHFVEKLSVCVFVILFDKLIPQNIHK